MQVTRLCGSRATVPYPSFFEVIFIAGDGISDGGECSAPKAIGQTATTVGVSFWEPRYGGGVG